MTPTDPAFGPETTKHLPYGGTSGRGGSDASADAKAREDESGTTSRRQADALNTLRAAGPLGLTYRELGARHRWHHGQSTGVLSTLHKVGEVARLATVRRANCSVYVLPEFVEGRAVAEHGRRKAAEREPFVMTNDEADLIAKLRRIVNSDRDKAVFPASKTSMRAVLEILDRATN